MIMIAFHHFSVHGGFEWNACDLTVPHLWYNFIIMGGKIGVDVFVLISGYFLINDNGMIFNIRRCLKFWGQLFFYSMVIFIISGALGITEFGLSGFIRACFPITFTTWWFASTYFVMFLIHPFLNILLRRLDKKLYQSLLVMLVICWSVIPTFTTSAYESNSLLWFVTLYSIAGYAKLYGFNKKFGAKHYALMFLIFSVITYLSSVVFTIIGSRWEVFSSYITYFYGQEKITILLISLSLFMAFVSVEIKHNKWINIIASATFGVYLIHDHGVIRPLLWLEIFKNAQYQDSLMLLPYSIAVVLLVYASCTVIDLARQKVFEKPYMIVVNRYADTWLRPFEKICNYFRDLTFGKSEGYSGNQEGNVIKQ